MQNLVSGPALIAYAFAGVMLLTTAILLLMTRSAQSAYTARDTVIQSRGPGKMIGGALVVAASVFAAPFLTTIDDREASSTLIVLLLTFAAMVLLIWFRFVADALVFYVADSSGLTRRWLNFTYTLSWYEIDWVYDTVNRVNYKLYGIVKIGQRTQYATMVEAGPHRKIKIVVKKGRQLEGSPEPLLQAIQQRATNARFGYNMSPYVIASRMAARGAQPS